MTCPNCGKDYADTKKLNTDIPRLNRHNSERIFIDVRPSYGDAFQISAGLCRSCGFLAEWIKYPSGNAYYAGSEVPEKMMFTNHDFWAYLESNGLIEEFKSFTECNRAKRLK